MYNHLLDTFKAVAEEGSFLKAAEKIFLTHTAVRKQINRLEEMLGARLFDRKTTGVSLNKAGKVLYEETLHLIKESDEIKRKVQGAYFSSPELLRVGSSNLYPCYIFMDFWDGINAKVPGWKLEVVPIDDEKNRLLSLGTDYDFLVGPYDSFSSGSPYLFKPIGNYRFTVACPRKNPLSSREEVSFSDIEGENLMIMQKGTSPINDKIRKHIEENFPKIRIVDIPPHYDIQTFNRSAQSGSLLLSLECWSRVHPELKMLRLKEKFSLPYGITFLKSSEKMQKFALEIDKAKM